MGRQTGMPERTGHLSFPDKLMPFALPAALSTFIKRLTVALAALALLVSICMLVVLTFGFRSTPLAIERPSVNKASLVYQLAHGRLLQRTLQGDAMHLSLPVSQLNALVFDLAQQTVGGRMAIHPLNQQLVALDVSLPAAKTPLKRYFPDAWINLQTRWQVADKGHFHLEHAQWGKLPVPAWLVQWVFHLGVAHQDLAPLLAVGMESIQQIKVQPKLIQINWQWRDDLRERTFAALIPATEIGRLKHHQEALAQYMEEAVPVAKEFGGYMPLLNILKPMFHLAQQRTMAQLVQPDGQVPAAQLPVNENRAALLVMTLHAMRIHPAELMAQAKDWPAPLPYPFTLRGRVDFAQHYLLSALIASGAGGRIADLIGLYKEKLDKISGSGFSFNDVAADRAGIRFGQRARMTPQPLQARVLLGEDEDYFMPDVDDMPQFLSAQEFGARFTGRNQSAYEAMLGLIDQRIDKLGVLQ